MDKLVKRSGWRTANFGSSPYGCVCTWARKKERKKSYILVEIRT